MNKKLRTPLIYLIVLVIIVLLVSSLDPTDSKTEEIGYTAFLDMVRKDQVQAVEITEQELIGIQKDSSITMEVFPNKYDFYTYIPSLERFHEDIAIIVAEKTGKSIEEITSADYGFSYEPNPPAGTSIWEIILPYILIFGAFALFYYFMFQSQGGGNKVMSFGKSRARTQVDMKNKVTDLRDIESLNFYRLAAARGEASGAWAAILKKGRDNARVPMQWSAERNGGFTKGEPWLMANPNYASVNVAAAERNPDSVLHFYRRLLRLRRENDALIYGEFVLTEREHRQVFAYRRILGQTEFTIACNMSGDEARLTSPLSGECVLGNLDGDALPGVLAPYEARVMKTGA